MRVLSRATALLIALSSAGCASCGVCPAVEGASTVDVATLAAGEVRLRSVVDGVVLQPSRAGCAAAIGDDELVVAADGGLTSLPSGRTTPSPAFITLAADDVDGDDVDELIGVNDLDVYVARQENGALLEPTQLATLPEGTRIPQLVDLDGDGLLDVLGAIGPQLVILLAPAFEAERVDVAGDDEILIATAVDDVDRDGDRDVVVAIGAGAEAITELAVVDSARAVRVRTRVDIVAGPLYVENGTLVIASGKIKVMTVTLAEFGEPADVILGNFGGVDALELVDAVFARVDGDGARDLVVETVVNGGREVIAYPRQGLGFNPPSTLATAALDASCLPFAAADGVAVVCTPRAATCE